MLFIHMTDALSEYLSWEDMKRKQKRTLSVGVEWSSVLYLYWQKSMIAKIIATKERLLSLADLTMELKACFEYLPYFTDLLNFFKDFSLWHDTDGTNGVISVHKWINILR